MQGWGRTSLALSSRVSARLLACRTARRSGAQASDHSPQVCSPAQAAVPTVPRRTRSLPALLQARRVGRLVLLAPTALGLVIGSPGCTTRADHPVVGADSTLVYVSKLPADVNAGITFQLKDSAIRDQEKRRDRERGREIVRLQKERERLLKLEDRQEKQRKLEEKRKAAAEKKAKKSKKGKKGKGRNQNEADTPPADGPGVASSGRTAGTAAQATPSPSDNASPASDAAPPLSAAALRDSLAGLESRLRALVTEDSLAALAPWKQKRPDGSPIDDRAVETEEGARVQANIRLENVYARGRRPLTFHFVWLNVEKKKIFKRMLEYTPNDSVQVLTSSLTISSTKRAPGFYTLQVFLFRELIAEKLLELRGTGTEEKEQGGDEAM